MRRLMALASILSLLAGSLTVWHLTQRSPSTSALEAVDFDLPAPATTSSSPSPTATAALVPRTSVPTPTRSVDEARALRRASRALAQRRQLVRPKAAPAVVTSKRNIRPSLAPRTTRPARPTLRPTHRATPRATPHATRTTSSSSGTYMGVMRTTKYCWTGSQTANSRWPVIGIVAVLDRSIPFGTVVRIEGMGTYVVDDWIGHGSDWDIYDGRAGCETRAADYGRQMRKIWIVHRG